VPKKYLESWKKAKSKFESATGKKKPDPKSRFGKLFSKINSTGLEGALKSYDAAKTVKEAQKHARAFRSAASNYIPTLDAAAKAAKQDGDTVYAEACDEMVAKLNKISANVIVDLERFDDMPEDVDGYFRSPYWYKKLYKYAKKEYATENIELYDKIFNGKLRSAKASSEAYDEYVADKSPKEVNIKSATRAACKKIAEKGNWTAMPWDAIGNELAANICDTLVRLERAVLDGVD
jgi:Regulator of G protein signaling domain.